jgi:hypothetical protein
MNSSNLAAFVDEPAHQASIDHEVCDSVQVHDMDSRVLGGEIMDALVGGVDDKEQLVKGFHRFKFFNGSEVPSIFRLPSGGFYATCFS